jgi:hypothetical protein
LNPEATIQETGDKITCIRFPELKYKNLPNPSLPKRGIKVTLSPRGVGGFD